MVFAVIATEGDPSPLRTAVETFFPGSAQVASNVWLVTATGAVAKDVSDRLGLQEGGIGTGIVLTVFGYYGYASNAIWEWLAMKRSIGSLP
jgi:hypothetical protein